MARYEYHFVFNVCKTDVNWPIDDDDWANVVYLESLFHAVEGEPEAEKCVPEVPASQDLAVVTDTAAANAMDGQSFQQDHPIRKFIDPRPPASKERAAYEMDSQMPPVQRNGFLKQIESMSLPRVRAANAPLPSFPPAYAAVFSRRGRREKEMLIAQEIANDRGKAEREALARIDIATMNQKEKSVLETNLNTRDLIEQDLMRSSPPFLVTRTHQTMEWLLAENDNVIEGDIETLEAMDKELLRIPRDYTDKWLLVEPNEGDVLCKRGKSCLGNMLRSLNDNGWTLRAILTPSGRVHNHKCILCTRYEETKLIFHTYCSMRQHDLPTYVLKKCQTIYNVIGKGEYSVSDTISGLFGSRGGSDSWAVAPIAVVRDSISIIRDAETGKRRMQERLIEEGSTAVQGVNF